MPRQEGMNQTAGHYSDALVDYSGLSKTLGGLVHSFSLLEFLDLCAILEGIVLHDRLVVVGGNSLVSGLFDTQPPQQSVPSHQALPGVDRSQGMERWRSLVKPLVDAGVLVAAPHTRPGNAGPKPADSAGERGFNVRAHLSRGSAPMIARSTELDSWYEAGRLIGAEQELECPPLALIRQRPFYERGGQTAPRHTVCDLMGRYQDLASALGELRSRTRLSMTSFLEVPVPPLPLMVLKLCSSYDDIVPRALDIREDYADLRASLRSLRSDLADDTLSPKKKLGAISSWQRSWATLRSYSDGSSQVEFASNALDIPDLNSAIEGDAFNAVSLNGLLKVLAQTGTRAFYSWRVRVLHRVARRYLATPDSELGAQVERLFRTRVTPEQLRALHVHWGAPGGANG